MSEEYEALKAKFDTSPYASFLGMKLLELAKGYAKVSMVVSPSFFNWGQRVHGGVIASLLDQAFGCSVNTLDRVYLAVQLSINFLSTPQEGDTLVSEARVVHAGKTLGVAELTVEDSSGRTIARAVGTALGMERRPTSR
jgi:acyl-CoA thioesterase